MNVQFPSEAGWRVGIAITLFSVACAGHALGVQEARTATLAWMGLMLALAAIYALLVVGSAASLVNEGERLLRMAPERWAHRAVRAAHIATLLVLVFGDGLLSAALFAGALGVVGLVECAAKDAYRATLGSPAQP
jgi:hypothetical protein